MGEGTEVLIPHLNRVEGLRHVLEALRAQSSPAAVCVVDNASTDTTAQVIPAEFPEVRYERMGENLGFGRAVNHGIRTSDARLVVLLNNDAVPEPAFVEEIERVQAASGAEMVAACLRRLDGAVDSLGVEVDQSLVSYDLAHGAPYPRAGDEALEPLGPTGGAGAYLRVELDAVGGFDEAIFAYLEDVELALRMRLHGARCALAYGAVAWHEHSATLGSGSGAKNALMGRSRGHLMWKHGAALTLAQRTRGAVIDTVVYAGQTVIDRNAAAARGRLEGRRARRGRQRPTAAPGFGELPLTKLSTSEGLRRRLRRRTGG